MAFNNDYRDNNPEKSADENELEQYGVWVKVGPEEISADEGESIDDEFELHDLNSDTADMIDEGELTDEEEELLGELENDLDSLGVDEHVTDFDLSFQEGNSADEDDNMNKVSTEESEDIDELETIEAVGDIDDIEELDIEELDDLPDLPGIEDKGPVENITHDLPSFDEEIEGLEPLDIDEDLLLDSDGLDDFSELDVDSMVEEDLAELTSEDDDLEELQLDVPEDKERPAVPAETETGQLDELESADSIEVPFLEQEIEDIDLEELEQNDYGEDLQELDQIQDESDVQEFEELSGFDDLQALEDELSLPSAASSPGDFQTVESDSDNSFSANTGQSDSAEILSKIERELLSIKSELSSLKEELSSIRAGGPVSPEVPFSLSEDQAYIEKTADEEADEAASFFEEDEDETIALTGDELDNILNTADITEESGTSETAPEEDSEVHFEQLDEDEPVAVQGGDIFNVESELEELTSDEEETLLVDDEDILGDEDIDSLNAEASFEKEKAEPAVETAGDAANEDINDADILDIDIDDIDDIDDIESGLDKSPSSAMESEISDDIFLEELEIDIPEEKPDDSAAAADLPEEEDILFEEDDSLEEELLELEEDPETAGDNFETSFEEGDLDNPDELSSAGPEPPEALTEAVESFPGKQTDDDSIESIPDGLRNEIKSVLSYMDQLLESLPEEKITEFANSDHFEVYKRLFDELGLNT